MRSLFLNVRRNRSFQTSFVRRTKPVRITICSFVLCKPARARKLTTSTENEEDHLAESIDRLYDLQIYPFTALELSSTVDEGMVAEVRPH